MATGQLSGGRPGCEQGARGPGRVRSVEVFPEATPDTALDKGTDVSGEASFSVLHSCINTSIDGEE